MVRVEVDSNGKDHNGKANSLDALPAIAGVDSANNTESSDQSARIHFQRLRREQPDSVLEDSVSIHINHAATDLYADNEEGLDGDVSDRLLQEVSAADPPDVEIRERTTSYMSHASHTSRGSRVSDGSVTTGILQESQSTRLQALSTLYSSSSVDDANDDDTSDDIDTTSDISALSTLAEERHSNWACWRYLLRYSIVRRFNRSKLMFLLK